MVEAHHRWARATMTWSRPSTTTWSPTATTTAGVHSTCPLSPHQAEGALLKGTAVCSGYAPRLRILLDAADIPWAIPSPTPGATTPGTWCRWTGMVPRGHTWDDPPPPGRRLCPLRLLPEKRQGDGQPQPPELGGAHTCTSTKYDEDLLDSTDQATAEGGRSRWTPFWPPVPRPGWGPHLDPGGAPGLHR